MKKIILILAIVILVPVIATAVWAAWYSFERQQKIAHNAECNLQFSQPAAPGSLQEICAYEVVPPTLWNLAHSHFVFEDLPPRFRVAIPVSLKEILLGRYSIQPVLTGCVQSATTTDCSTFPTLPQAAPGPYIPPNSVHPVKEWKSMTATPVSFNGFSFILPPGWHGSVYEKGFAGGLHALVQKESDAPGFVIDCPPDGIGLEAATRLSSEERSFTTASTTYSVAIEKWTAPGNMPWYFVWVRAHEPGDFSTDQSSSVCLAQGRANLDIKTAMKELYETWK